MGETLHTPVATRANRLVRGALTWHLYLLFGFFQLIVNLQGNIFPLSLIHI